MINDQGRKFIFITLTISKRLKLVFPFRCNIYLRENVALVNCRSELHVLNVYNGEVTLLTNITVLRMIKLTKVPLPLRFRLLEILLLFHHVLQYLRTLYIVWSR